MGPEQPTYREVASKRQGAPGPDRVIVLSDLHMAAGVQPGGGRDPLEQFRHDREVAALLARLSGRCVRRGRRASLVLNGDVFDFVRVVRLPVDSSEVAAWGQLLERSGVCAPSPRLAAAAAGRFTARERRYGLDATEHDSIWKLLLIARGHPLVFAALAEWCRAGHELVIVRGNHDVEWAWPGVRRALRLLLSDVGSGPLPGSQLRFRMRDYRRANLHIEHGHSIRWTTAVEGRFTAARTLKQPFGSFVNRYLLNPVEQVTHQEADSMSLRVLLRREPLRHWRRLLRHALRGLPPVGRSTWRIWHRRAHGWWPTRVGNASALGVFSLPLLFPDLLAALPLDSMSARTGVALLAFATPHLGLALLEALDSVHANNTLRARALAACIARRGSGNPASDQVVILGHTHNTELLSWPQDDHRVVYANPGCWSNEEGTGSWCPRFVWCAWDGRAYGRARIVQLEGGGRCRTHSKS